MDARLPRARRGKQHRRTGVTSAIVVDASSAGQTGQQSPFSHTSMPAATEAVGSMPTLPSTRTRSEPRAGRYIAAQRHQGLPGPAQQASTRQHHARHPFGRVPLFSSAIPDQAESTFIRKLNREIVPTSSELVVAGENLHHQELAHPF